MKPVIARLAAASAMAVLAAAAPAVAASSTPAAWSAAHNLSSSPHADPDLSENAAGAAIAVWQQQRVHGLGKIAMVATRDAANHWTAARVLTVPGRASEAIFAGVGGHGRAVMVWAAQPVAGGATHVLWAQREPGGAWSPSTRIVGQTTIPETFFLSSAGWGVIAYERHGIGYVRVVSPRGRWGPAKRVTAGVPKVHHDAVGTHINVRAVISSRGAVTASWATITVDTRSRTAGDYERGGLTASGERLAPVTVATGQSAYAGRPYLFGSASGDSAAIEWDSPSDLQTLAFRLAGGRWQDHVLRPEGDTLDGNNAGEATVGVADDRLAIWWQSWTSTVATLWQARYDGRSWSDPISVAHYDDTGPTSLASYGAVSDSVVVFGWTHYQVTAPEGRHDSTVRTTTATESDDLTLGPRSVVSEVAAAGKHAAVVWTGTGGLFVQTR